MAKLGDRVQETTTTTGTGTFALNGAVTGYVTFNSTFTNGDIVWYVADDGAGNWEIGTGTVGTGTLTRTVFQSSNSNNLVSFAAGAKRLFCTAPYTYLLPDQTGQDGKFLLTSSGVPSWSTISQMTYPGAGIPVSTGSAWSTSKAAPTGDILGTTDTQNVSNKTITSSSLNSSSIGASSPSTGAFTTLSATGTTTLATSLTGLLKGTSGVVSTATSGTDYAPATSGTSILKGNGSGGFSSAVANTDYLAVNNPIATGTLKLNGSSSGYVGFQGAAAAGSTTYTLPSTDGSNGQVLSTNGTGTLAWTTAATTITISNDTTTATAVYPAFLSATSGTAATLYTGNAKLLYTPSTGEFAASEVNASNGIFVNSQTIAANYTISATNNGLSAGPVTVASGITVTVSSGAVWTVV